MKFVRVSLKIRRNSWPPLLTGHVRSSRKRPVLLPPPPPPPPTRLLILLTFPGLGQDESKGDSCDRGKTPSKKTKKSSHRSSSKKKPDKTPDFKTELKSMDDNWSERFARLEAMFLAKSFQVPVEPFQKSDADKPFIPPVQQPTGITSQKKSSGAASQKEMKEATQPVEVPGAVTATRPVEVPGALTATQRVEVPGAVTATRPVEVPGAVTATQRVEVPGAVTATQPVEALVLHLRCYPPARTLLCLLMLADPRFSPQVPLLGLLHL